MKKISLILALVFSLGLNVGLLIRAWSDKNTSAPFSVAPAQASNPNVPNGRLSERSGRLGIRQMADRLGLEGEQRQRFRDIKRDFFSRTRAQRLEMRRLQSELSALLAESPIDRRRVAEAVQELGTGHRDLEQLFVDHYLATLEILDPEQQKIYREHILDRVVRSR